MTKSDKEEIKEILHDYVRGVIAQSDAKFEIIDYKLDAVITQTTKTNGRVCEHDKRLNDLKFWAWMVEKPFRLVSSVILVVVLSRLITNEMFINFVLKLFA